MQALAREYCCHMNGFGSARADRTRGTRLDCPHANAAGDGPDPVGMRLQEVPDAARAFHAPGTSSARQQAERCSPKTANSG